MVAARTYILPWAMEIGPKWFQRLVVGLLPWKRLHEARDIIDMMETMSLKIYREKRKALQEGDEAIAQQIGEGKDIISILSAFVCLLCSTV
jgi:hypothetical protein